MRAQLLSGAATMETDLKNNRESKSSIGNNGFHIFHELAATLLWHFPPSAGYDDVLGVIGAFGLWQKRSTVFLWIIIAFVGFPFLVYSFALAKPGTFFSTFISQDHPRYSIRNLLSNRVSMLRAGL